MIQITEKTKGHLHITCTSEFDHLDLIIDSAETFLDPHIDDADLAYKIVLLLSEAVTNAMEHGNKLDASKKVLINLLLNQNQVKLTVEDQGEGFDQGSVKNPTEKENLLMDGGRGIFFIEQMADNVSYELNGRRIHIFFNR